MLKLVPSTKLEEPTVSDERQETALDLMESIATGDKGAFSQLYTIMSPKVFGVVLYLVKDRAQTEEVCQEIFLEIWQKAPQYNPTKGAVNGWIIGIARRRAIDRIRASQASRDRDLKIGVRDYTNDYDNVAETLETNEEKALIHKAMNRLTDYQKQAVKLTYFGGYSSKEVSEILSIPVGTVKTRLRDGMIRLRDELGVAS